MKRHRAIVLLLGMLVIASSAYAQDKGHFGLVMGFPTNIAVIWHPTGGFAIRPEISLSGFSSGTVTTVGTASVTASSNQTIMSVAVNASSMPRPWTS